jgi:hypothetical protein
VVGQHLGVDDVGKPSFEGPHGFHGGLAGGLLSVVVGPPFGGVAQLDDGCVSLPREQVVRPRRRRLARQLTSCSGGAFLSKNPLAPRHSASGSSAWACSRRSA